MTYILNLRSVNQFTDWIGKAILKTRSWMQTPLKENVLGALWIVGLITAFAAPFTRG